jgi:hypothetical protein
MVDPAAESNAPKQKHYFRAVVVCFGLFLIGILPFLLIGPLPGGIQPNLGSGWLQNTRTIGIAMFQYSNDHNSVYPDGESSTEVFQKLLDEKYISDPTIFYIPLPGKIKPIEGQPLKPENVCFDVTSGIDSNASDGLPIVFTTGYKINYVPGGGAVPLIKPFPQYGMKPLTWTQWWDGVRQLRTDAPWIAIAYKSNSAATMRPKPTDNSDGTIQNVVPTTFDAKGKTYRQLIPDGPLP